MALIPGLKPYYEEKGFVLYHGDALELLPELPEESFDLIFADPPYRLSNDGFTCQAGRRVSVNKGDWDKSKGVEEDFGFHLKWISLCRHPLKQHGSIWISGTMHSVYQCGYALQLAGYKLLNDIAWYKPNASPNLSARYFTHSHETLLWARKFKNAKHIFNYRLMKEGDWGDDFLKKPNKQMRSIWAIGTPPREEKVFGKHPTQKPLELLLRVILASTEKKNIVLDPFTGSSTTGLACWLTGRVFVGFDVEERYLELSVKRLERLKNYGRERKVSPSRRTPETKGQTKLKLEDPKDIRGYIIELGGLSGRQMP